MSDGPGEQAALAFLMQLVAEGRAVVPAAVTLAILQALVQQQQLHDSGAACRASESCCLDMLCCIANAVQLAYGVSLAS